MLGILHFDQFFPQEFDLVAELVYFGFVLLGFEGFEAVVAEGVAEIGTRL